MAYKIVKRYSENPFLDEFFLNTRKRMVKVLPIHKSDKVIVDKNSGEIKGTLLATYKEYEDEQFVKVFADKVKLTFDLKQCGVKALNVLIWSVQNYGKEKTLVPLDPITLSEYIKAGHPKMSESTFSKGLRDLEEAKIIAKSTRRGSYFFDPGFIFNGNRIVYAEVIDRKRREGTQEGLSAIEVEETEKDTPREEQLTIDFEGNEPKGGEGSDV